MKKLRRIQQRNAKKHNKLKQRAIAAGTVAAITLGTRLNINKAFAKDAPDRHQISVNQDTDADLLADSEEIAVGYRPFKADQNLNEIPDGVELAKSCANVINELPTYTPGTRMPIPNGPYKIQHALFGIEFCEVCGQEVNMGGITIINPTLGLQYPDPNDPLDGMFLPDLALHYMEHGSFDCFGDVHTGRIDIPRLLRVIEHQYPHEPNEHQLAIDDNDLDGDMLIDNEELRAGYNLYDSDQDEDLIPDGIELAKQCAEIIDSLPIIDPNSLRIPALHKINFLQRGIEICDICGESVNMGYQRITNLKYDLSIDVPFIVSHYMEHGSFSYSGDVHNKGRINVPLLAKVLEMPQRCGDLGTIYSPEDVNHDCQVNIDDLLEFFDQWLEQTDYNQGKHDEQ